MSRNVELSAILIEKKRLGSFLEFVQNFSENMVYSIIIYWQRYISH